MRTAGLLPSPREVWPPVGQAARAKPCCLHLGSADLSEATDVAQALMQLLQSGTFIRGLEAACSPVQALGKDLGPPQGLSYEQVVLKGTQAPSSLRTRVKL